MTLTVPPLPSSALVCARGPVFPSKFLLVHCATPPKNRMVTPAGSGVLVPSGTDISRGGGADGCGPIARVRDHLQSDKGQRQTFLRLEFDLRPIHISSCQAFDLPTRAASPAIDRLSLEIDPRHRRWERGGRFRSPGDDVTPERFVTFWRDGSRGLYFHSNIWHGAFVPHSDHARFRDRQGRVHARVSVNFPKEFCCYLASPLRAPR